MKSQINYDGHIKYTEHVYLVLIHAKLTEHVSLVLMEHFENDSKLSRLFPFNIHPFCLWTIFIWEQKANQIRK